MANKNHLEVELEALSQRDLTCLRVIVQRLFSNNVASLSYEEISRSFSIDRYDITSVLPDDKRSILASKDFLGARSPKIIDDFPMPLLRKSLNLVVERGFLQRTLDKNTSHFELSADFADLAHEIYLQKFVRFDAISGKKPTADIPAADRFVSVDHNSSEIMEAVKKLVELEERVESSNEFAADKEQRSAVKQELVGIRELLSGSKIRVASVFAAVGGSGILYWLAAHASDAILNSLAGQTISLLSKAFGFGT